MKRIVAAIVVLGTLATAPSALAVPDCGRTPAPRILASGLGLLESVIVDDRGRIYFTDSANGILYRLDNRRATPQPIVTGIRAPGGLTFMPDGDLLVGFGDSAATASRGTENPQAGLLRVDTKTGATSTFASGLTMA